VPDDVREGALPPLDTRLLAGFSFACRPDCGLCCYATPRVTSTELIGIHRLDPTVRIVGSAPDTFLAARPEGGACQFLASSRCRLHSARPGPCREYPISVHVGERLQATVVLSCPGIDLKGLGRRTAGEPTGLESELEAVRGRIDARTGRRVREATRRRRQLRRRLEEAGLWQDEEAVRRDLRAHPPRVAEADFPTDDPPEVAEGLDTLPLYFDGREGPVAIASTLGGWELLELRELGGTETPLGVFPPPERPPALDAAGAELLRAYLGYWVERDALFGYVASAVAEAGGPDLGTAIRSELGRLGALVLARGAIRAKSRGHDGARLGEADVARGIRAVDQEALDRPTWGDRL
jgi:Fe-S-cluster containining protein